VPLGEQDYRGGSAGDADQDEERYRGDHERRAPAQILAKALRPLEALGELHRVLEGLLERQELRERRLERRLRGFLVRGRHCGLPVVRGAQHTKPRAVLLATISALSLN